MFGGGNGKDNMCIFLQCRLRGKQTRKQFKSPGAEEHDAHTTASKKNVVLKKNFKIQSWKMDLSAARPTEKPYQRYK